MGYQKNNISQKLREYYEVYSTCKPLCEKLDIELSDYYFSRIVDWI